MLLNGRRAVVTGATRGIGAAVARALADAGATSLLVGRDAQRLTETALTIARAVPYVADLARADAVARLRDEAPRLLGGPVDILVNNAGIFATARIDDVSDSLLDEMLAVNLAAPFRLVRSFLPAMRERMSGHIVTIGSIADREAFPRNSAYSATKFGTRALHQVTRAETWGSGVRATLISPGPTDTPLWDPLDPDNDPQFTPRAQMLRAEHVADAVVWAVTRPQDVNVDELRLSHV